MARTISEAVLAARGEVAGVGGRIKVERDVAAAGLINAERLAKICMIMSQSKVHLTSLQIGPKHQGYARTDIDIPGFDIEARLADVQTALTDLVEWVVTNYPQSPNGFQETRQFTLVHDPDPLLDKYGITVERKFDSAFTAGFVTAADAFSVAAAAFVGD